jgi:hypothetical protein
MRQKGKRTKRIEVAHPFEGMSKVNPCAAGVDIGAEEIVVCVAPSETTQLVRGFGNYTVDLHAIAAWLVEHDIKTVAMESTGVYWIPLFEVLEPGGKKSEEEIGKALTGTWREEHLFVLKQAVALYDFYTQQILECDQEIECLYSETHPDWDGGELQPLSSRKRNSHSKNQFYESEKIRGHLKRISGVDISLVDGMGVSLAQTVILECGTDMSKFPTDKHFCSWLGLAPKHKISGGKVLNNKTLKTKNRAGQAFRMAAQSVKQADCAFGVLYRRLRARLGPAQATVATAHAIARVVYRMLKYKVEYAPLSVNEYQKQYEEQQIKYIKKRAAKLGYQLMPVPAGKGAAQSKRRPLIENALFRIKTQAESGRFLR